MKTLILIVFLLLSHQSFAARQHDLTLLSYNIYTIPCLKNKTPLQKLIVKLFGRKCPIEGHYSQTINQRIEKFKEHLAQMNNDPDVILIQEAFSSRARIFEDYAIKNLALKSYPYKAEGPKSHHKSILDFIDGSILKPKLNANGALGSGLLIFSKYPLKNVQTMKFSECEFSDCASVKGLLKVTLKHPTLGDITLINTHLQAEDQFDEIRVNQIQEIYNFLQDHEVLDKVIFAGDFNFQADELFYPSFGDFKYLFYDYDMSSALCKQDSLCRFTDSVSEEYKNGLTWDHSFTKGTTVSRYSTPNWEYQGLPLSDHKPLLIDYIIQ